MISLRPVNQHDWQFLYDLLAERPIEANISHREMPSLATHVAFVRSSPYAAWYIIESNHQPAGAIYLTHQAEIGIQITSQYRGNGLGKLAITELMHQHPKQRFLANIAPLNAKSQKLFMDLGFQHIQNTYELRS